MAASKIAGAKTPLKENTVEILAVRVIRCTSLAGVPVIKIRCNSVFTEGVTSAGTSLAATGEGIGAATAVIVLATGVKVFVVVLPRIASTTC